MIDFILNISDKLSVILTIAGTISSILFFIKQKNRHDDD